MRSGLTLIETLLALAILSALMIAAVGWMQSATAASAAAGATLRWEAAAHAAMRAIHDDLLSGDFELNNGRNDWQSSPPRVRLEGHTLFIDTRSGGRSVECVYSLDRDSKQLIRRADGERLILSGVVEITCELDEVNQVVTIAIDGLDSSVVRRFVL